MPPGFFGLWEWILLALLIMVWYLLQFYESPIYVHARDWWAVFSAAYVALHALHWCLTLVGGTCKLRGILLGMWMLGACIDRL
jgi:hypothetical protein